MSIWQYIQDYWRAPVEILILTILLYQVFLNFRATRAARILTGLLTLLVVLTFLSQVLDLKVIGSLISSFYLILSVALVVIFQPELRRALAKLGSHRFFDLNTSESDFIEIMVESVKTLSNKRFGALFAFERQIDLDPHLETGVELDAKISPELIATIFHPRTALHDGGVVLNQDRIRGAGCVFPLSQREMTNRSIGLRHRAGLGISEETDAIAVVVSEETGNVSLCHGGKIEQNIKVTELADRLRQLLNEQTANDNESDQESSVS
ncbi:diadenylate cyclase CdaA [Sulfuriroseicoccus oceanibius]|uniref:Diadenylate cyclase n=1 Tax=Sulfuriroseicoccus oceanibius TaxID=2707525 RepID=A0A6B3LA78_9BACT|nr:diadenylate cyclase CdaA [Sulfuriroseicoccus oceanibius]QQL45382.1 TIGR00159 family protein [Sulfuriroseicoccus oceanibius]